MRTILGTAALVLAGAVGACSSAGEGADGPVIVVSTSILGDVVGELVGDAAEVEVLMPAGADPHEFSLSAKQAATMRAADALVVNGLGFEAGLVDSIDAAAGDGVPLITATDAIEPLPFAGGDGHDGDGDLDPHLFNDPRRMHAAVGHIAARLEAEVPSLGTGPFRDGVGRYLGELEALDAELEATLAAVPPARRLLVTNHDVFGYFADRYAFEVLGVVIPGGSTLAEPSPAGLAGLVAQLEAHDVPAVFADTSSPARLAAVIADEGRDVEVVELYSESLGEPGTDGDTYVGMMRSNARRIVEALT
jgi:zinc/manganese transport system substrate-binding protein